MPRLAFGFVVLCETIVAITGWIGVVALATHLRAPHDQWNAAKFWAVVALGGALAIWFILFEIGGNEWFASWQSPTWNAASDTARINLVTLLGVLLVVGYNAAVAQYYEKPIEQIEESLLKVINGDRDHRVNVEHAELGGIVYRINQLISELTGVEEGDGTGGGGSGS